GPRQGRLRDSVIRIERNGPLELLQRGEIGIFARGQLVQRHPAQISVERLVVAGSTQPVSRTFRRCDSGKQSIGDEGSNLALRGEDVVELSVERLRPFVVP